MSNLLLYQFLDLFEVNKGYFSLFSSFFLIGWLNLGTFHREEMRDHAELLPRLDFHKERESRQTIDSPWYQLSSFFFKRHTHTHTKGGERKREFTEKIK
jgi:hypothetical protein